MLEVIAMIAKILCRTSSLPHLFAQLLEAWSFSEAKQEAENSINPSQHKRGWRGAVSRWGQGQNDILVPTSFK